MPTGISTGVNTAPIAPARPVRDPARRRPDLHEQADLLHACSSSSRVHRASCSSDGAFGLRRALHRARTPTPPRPSASTSSASATPRWSWAALIAGLGGCLVLAGVAGRVRGQHDQRSRVHRPRRASSSARWRPWTAFAGAMLFGFARALGSRIQILGVEIGDFAPPRELWQALPVRGHHRRRGGGVGRATPCARRRRPVRAVTMSGARHRLGPRCGTPRSPSRARLRALLRLPPVGPAAAWWTTAGCSRRQRGERLLRPVAAAPRCGVVVQLHATGGGRLLVAIAVVDSAGAGRSSPCGRCRQLLSRARRARAARGRAPAGRAAPRPFRPRPPPPDGRHRPRSSPSATAAGCPTRRSTGSSTPTPGGPWRDEQASALLMAILFRGLDAGRARAAGPSR